MKAPGKAHRKGLALLQVADMFRDETAAKAWIAECRWPNGPHCPDCGSFHVQSGIKHRTMTHRCRDCPERPMFSLRKGTIMEGSKLPHRIWAIGIYLFATNLKGVSSMKLHRELGIGQKAAWFMLHRLRTTKETSAGGLSGQLHQGRHNHRESDTVDQMSGIVEGVGGERLRYRDLIKSNGLPSGARG